MTSLFSGNDREQLKKTLHAGAVTGGIFTLVFLAMLIINGYQQYVSGSESAARLTDLKHQLLSQPDNEDIIAGIRELDREYRAEKLRQLDFSGTGSVMLLLSAVITIGALKWKFRLERKVPEQCPDTETPYITRRLSASRIALILSALVLSGSALFLGQQAPSGWISGLDTGGPDRPDYAAPDELMKNWNRFRGFSGAGIIPFTDLPDRWDGETGENILWKTAINLPGHNSPVVWEDRIFLSGATREKREVYCIDASSGSILWTGEVPTAPSGGRKLEIMDDTGYAASSMATDGVRVYAVFASGDLAAFDFNGRLLWNKSLGIPESLYGHASSLEVWKNRVIVQYDQGIAEDEKSRLYAFEGSTGKTVWEIKRPVPNGWTSPIVAKPGDDYVLITVGDPWVIAYNPEDGSELWRADCVRGDVGASPILSGDLVIAIEPDMKNVAVRTGGTGDVTETHIAWENGDVGPTLVSPVSDNARVFFLDTFGILYVIGSLDGSFLYEYDFGENVKASPSMAGNRMYVLSVDGNMFIGIPGEQKFNLEIKNSLGEECFASPAFMPGRIYIRGKEHLYCIGNG